MAIDLKELVNALDDRYPRWIVDGLARSPEVRAMQTALQALAKTSTGTSSPLKELGDSAKKASNSFDDIIKKHASNTKTMSSVMQDIGKSSSSLARSTFSAMGAISKFSGAVGLVGSALGYFYEVMSKNSVAYVKAAQSGFLLSNSLTGTTDAAVKANIAFDDFVDIMVKNSSTLAVWGKDSQNRLGNFLYDIRMSSDRVARFGFGISEINEFATEYLDIQRKQGILTRKNDFEQNIAAGQFIDNLATFSSVLGYSRKSLLDSVKKSSEDTSWSLYVRSRISSEKGLSDSFAKAATIVSGLAGPQYGTKLLELMQDFVVFGTAVSSSSRETLQFLTNNNPELLKELGTMAENVKSQRILTQNTSDVAGRFAEGVASFEKDNRLNQAMIQNQIGYNSEYIGLQTQAGLHLTNLRDKLKEGNKSWGEYIKEQDNAREKNAKTQAGFVALTEILAKINNMFEQTASEIINTFFGSIEGFADYMDKTIKPALLSFAAYTTNLFTPAGRQKMLDDLTDVISTAIHDGIWGKSKKKKTPTPQPTGGSSYEAAARMAARKHGIDENMFVRLMYTESGGNPNATSKVGAKGLTQLMPETAAELGVTNPYDPYQSLEGGAKYFAQLRKRYANMGAEQDRYALAAYNWGMGNVDRKGLSAMGKETRNYVNKILTPTLSVPTPSPTSSVPTPSPSSTPMGSGSDDVVSLLRQQNEYLRATNENLTSLNYKFSDNNWAMRKLTNTVKDSSSFL